MKPSLLRLLPLVLAFSSSLAACRQAPARHGETKTAAASQSEAKEEREELPARVKLAPTAITEAGIVTWQVKPVDLAHLLMLTGSVGHDENRLLQLAANVRGRVAAIPVDLGARVRKGDPVIEIESVELGRAREEYLKELSAYRVSARAYERAKALVAAKAISSGEFQSREGEYLSHEAAQQATERTLRLYGESADEIARLRETVESRGALPSSDPPRLVLRSPFAGRVIDRKVTPGALVEALQPLATIADISTVWVFLQAYEKDLALLRNGLPVTIRTEAYPRESFHGRIDFLGSVVDSPTRTVKVRATVANPSEKLRPGMFVKGQIEIDQAQSPEHPVVAVPDSALQQLEGRTTLFVRSEPGVFVRRVVETGRRFEGVTEILNGVKAGEVIVTEGSFVLKSEFSKASVAEGE